MLPAIVGAVAERTLYRPMYGDHLDHVLFSIGLVFMAVAAVDYLVGSQQQIIKLPEFLQGRFEIGGVGIGRYRLFIVIICLVLTAILQLVRAHALRQPAARRWTIRASPPTWASTSTRYSASRSRWVRAWPGWAARWAPRCWAGPELPAQVHDLFPHRRVGGRHDDHHRPAAGALLLGIADVFGKYYVPSWAPSWSTR